MANDVFANGREISCKKADGKAIAALPDVCMTPPECPATPPGVPVPYPNTGMAKDMTAGSKSVKISDQEVMLRNKSYFKTSYGDEAGCAAKKGVVSSKIKGKVYFTSWSPNVKIEKKNAVRHLDRTTHNHGSNANENIPWPYADTQTISGEDKCAEEKKAEKEACKDYKPNKGKKKDVCKAAGLSGRIQKKAKWAKAAAAKAEANDCIKARRCRLSPYNARKNGIKGCCRSQTPDHLIPKASFFSGSVKSKKKLPGWKKYSVGKAPCMCAEGGNNTHGSHGLRHAHHKAFGPKTGSSQTSSDAAALGAKGAVAVFKSSNCSEACIKAQLEEGHKKLGKGDVKHAPSGTQMSKSELNRKLRESTGSAKARGAFE